MKLPHNKLKTKLPVPETTRIDHSRSFPKISLYCLSGDFCVSKCTDVQRGEILMTLYKISQKSWLDLQQLSRKNGGHENIPVSQLRCNIPQRFKNSSVALSFHNPDKIPIIGFREEDTFFVIAVDPKLKAYKH